MIAIFRKVSEGDQAKKSNNGVINVFGAINKRYYYYKSENGV